MSATGTEEVVQVRRLLKDPDTGEPAVDTDVIKQALDRSVPLACGYMRLGTSKVDTFLTLAAGTSTYALAATTPYQMIGELRFASDNALIERKSREYVESLRAGARTASGRPQMHYLEPQQDGTTNVVFWPTPSSVENVTAWVNLEPQAWGSAQATSTIPFSQGGLRGLELLTAAAVVDELDGAVLNQIELDAKVADKWRAEAMEHFRIERLKVIRMKRAAGPLSINWLSDWAGVYIGPLYTR